jgi:hypothetical protein
MALRETLSDSSLVDAKYYSREGIIIGFGFSFSFGISKIDL